ncbi:MAG: ornithine carbamoyltransferase, partial [Deltaproteobacteria bacterium]
MKRDLISIADLAREEIDHLFEVAARLKADLEAGRKHDWLPGKTLAMIFEKPSLRTRVTFETGMNQLGGVAIYLGPADILLGRRESVPDIGKNLSLWVDIIMARTYLHRSVVELAESARVPVINGLSDLYHPCQVLADCFTLRELRGRLDDLRVVFVGDGNNMVHSWLMAAAKLDFHFTLVCPPGYEPNAEILATARTAAGGRLEVTHDLKSGTAGADVLYTDVWASMGQENEAEQRRRVFAPYQLNSEVVANAADGVHVMHCLPAHRGEEITAEVIDGPNSVVLRQAENRLHLQKAIIAWLLG